jgi:hypothetical protein
MAMANNSTLVLFFYLSIIHQFISLHLVVPFYFFTHLPLLGALLVNPLSFPFFFILDWCRPLPSAEGSPRRILWLACQGRVGDGGMSKCSIGMPTISGRPVAALLLK